MEIARDVEGVSSEVRSGERTTTRSNLYPSCFQGSGGINSRVEMVKETSTEPGSSSHVSTA